MSVALQHNIGGFLRAAPGLPSTAATTKSSDSVGETVGRIVDRLNVGGASRPYQSVKCVVPFNGTWASSVGVRVTGRMLHATSTAAGDFSAFGSTGIVKTFATTTTATSTSHQAVAEFDFDLRTARRFLQFNVAVDLIASSSGSVAFQSALVFGGPDELPPTVTVAPISTTS